jgi:hypothetical protein
MRLFFSVKTDVFDLHMVRPSCWEDVVKFKNIRFIFGGRSPKGLTGGPKGHPSYLGILVKCGGCKRTEGSRKGTESTQKSGGGVVEYSEGLCEKREFIFRDFESFSLAWASFTQGPALRASPS